MPDIQPKISFCSTCMNRKSQLQSTLEKNLNAIKKTNGQAELVLVNFIKDDEGNSIHEWIMGLGEHANFRYFTTTELSTWHASVAKNTAHLYASSDYLINLDCDNFLDESIIRQIIDFNDGDLSNVIFSGFTGKFKSSKPNNLGRIIKKATYKLFGKNEPIFLRSVRGNNGEDHNGTYGHIGLSKKCFLSIGGYNESLPPMGGQDRDLLLRAYNYHKTPLLLQIPPKTLPIQNDKESSLANTNKPEKIWKDLDLEAKAITKKAILNNKLAANRNGLKKLLVTRYR